MDQRFRSGWLKDTWAPRRLQDQLERAAALGETCAQIDIVFQTASPFDTPRLMTELMACVNQERETVGAVCGTD